MDEMPTREHVPCGQSVLGGRGIRVGMQDEKVMVPSSPDPTRIGWSWVLISVHEDDLPMGSNVLQMSPTKDAYLEFMSLVVKNTAFLKSLIPNIISHSLPHPSFFPQQSKNTCAHNNTQKAHANGIKKKKRNKYVSTKGMDPKFLRNQKFCKKYNHVKRVHEE
eukprot:CAMPEP_0172305730 /NCGR_PEP_ID=MMETSP1058-20130122/6962_1 /TAXON_ID=83371 /ORGANISM="Detonula confervacea, Strain CCMP 353" /LENGTH=162 /DNA_ID=CAMNT_0013017425 /DNA_START=275 /DNA_END=762 /DNA_ORIENTATION=+